MYAFEIIVYSSSSSGNVSSSWNIRHMCKFHRIPGLPFPRIRSRFMPSKTECSYIKFGEQAISHSICLSTSKSLVQVCNCVLYIGYSISAIFDFPRLIRSTQLVSLTHTI